MKKALEDLKSFVTVAMIVLLYVIVVANIFNRVISKEILILVTNLITAVFTYYFSKDRNSSNVSQNNDEKGE